MKFGIYIARFKDSIYDKKYGEDILGSYVIGETDLASDTYRQLETVEEIVKDRLLKEARKNSGKKGFARVSIHQKVTTGFIIYTKDGIRTGIKKHLKSMHLFS